jgi:cyclophilin family peptidyl-prolyl cis-trans isomerase
MVPPLKYKSLIIRLLLVVLIFFSAISLADSEIPKMSEKRIVFRTQFGDLVFALYPEVAPLHVEQLMKLTELGVFDHGQVMRVIPNFVVQFSDQYRRLVPLSKEQANAITKIKAEFSPTLKHKIGILTMARYDDDIHSATMSFSIMLGPAPHLDKKYTIFGHLESGGSVVDRILSIPLDGEKPSQQIAINKAFIVHDTDEYYAQNPVDPTENMGRVQTTQIIKTKKKDTANTNLIPELPNLIALLLVAIVLVSLLGALLSKHLSPNRLVSLLLVNVLIAGFGIFIIVTPATAGSTWLGLIVFMGLFGLFRLMSRFERGS